MPPLLSDDPNTAVAHQEDCKDHNRQHKNKKDETLSSNRKHEPDVPSIESENPTRWEARPRAGNEVELS
jgi:hypothetical protein